MQTLLYLEVRIFFQNAALSELHKNQATKTKIRSIQYDKLQMQEYLISGELTNKEATTIATLRAKCVRGVRNQFKKMYTDTKCPLKCGQEDTQEHILECIKLTNTPKITMDSLNGSNVEKKELAKEFSKLMRKRERLLEIEGEMPPGATQDQCTQPGVTVVN